LKRFVCEWVGKSSRFKVRGSKFEVQGSKFEVQGARSHSQFSLVNPSSRVAIIGSGPAGLTCAYDLVKMGHKAVVFESGPIAGGMLSLGIPEYRLPRRIVQEEIEEIENSGVEIKRNVTIGRDLTLNELRDDGYKAIFIAIGAHRDRRLGIPGENLKGVLTGLSFLKGLNFGNRISLGKRVAVIGGGNTAVDAARSSVRSGAKEVYLIYRRTKEEMPAVSGEVEQAEEEGVKILYLTSPVEITGNKGKVSEIRCVALVLGEKDDSGRRRPLSIPSSSFSLKVDNVIVAIGQIPDLSVLGKDNGFRVDEEGALVVHPLTFATDVEGIFAAGDMVSGPSTVIEAIAAGKKAALSIDRYLKGESLEGKKDEGKVAITLEKVLRGQGFPEQRERKSPLVPSPEVRRGTFKEVRKTFTEEQAIEEAKRCLACGCGLGCGVCEKVCIYSAIERVDGRYKVDGEKCDGCGLCVEICPKENIKMVED